MMSWILYYHQSAVCERRIQRCELGHVRADTWIDGAVVSAAGHDRHGCRHGFTAVYMARTITSLVPTDWGFMRLFRLKRRPLRVQGLMTFNRVPRRYWTIVRILALTKCTRSTQQKWKLGILLQHTRLPNGSSFWECVVLSQ